MGNISQLSQLQTAATSLSNLILVSPQSTIGYQPNNPPNPNGSPVQNPPALLFHYEGEQTVSLHSDITDNYIEDNTALQDQIALKPIEITTHGFIGELNDVPPAALAIVKSVADKLTTIGAYQPSLSVSALLAYNIAFQLYQTAANAVNSAVSAWSTITSTGGESVISTGNVITVQPNQTKQQVMFQQLFGYWNARTLFTVQTPWAVFTNMAIKDLISIQDEKTNMITDFSLTFKQINIASTQTSIFDPSNLQGRAAFQGAGTTNLGTSTPASSTSLNSGLSGAYPGLGVSA